MLSLVILVFSYAAVDKEFQTVSITFGNFENDCLLVHINKKVSCNRFLI